jgi:hypothetical protein
MKKFAILAVTGFIASSMVACGGDEGEEEELPPPISFGGGWDATGQVQLGGSSHATLGSFADLDAFKVYLLADAKTNKAKIDLIFDGANFLTPEGCDDASFCKDVYNQNEVAIVKAPNGPSASASAGDVAQYFDGLCWDADGDFKDSCINSKVSADKNGKYFVMTSASTPTVAYVIVNGDVSTSVVLDVARGTLE